MNPFFDISEKAELPDEAFALKNLGAQQAWITSGRRGSDFWGTSGSSSKTTYRDTTDEDYDQQFVRKLVRWKPIYNISQLVEHHHNFYLSSGHHAKDDFLKHMRYVILPIIKKKPNSEACAQLFEEWLNDREKQKPAFGKILKTTGINKTVHRIHFDDLSWSDFERLIFAFVKRMRPWKTIDWLGQAGQDDGQDIWGESLGKTYCYLCANYQALTNRKANDDIDKLIKHNAIPDYLIIVCGGKVSAGVNKSIKAYAQSKGINNVEIWSGADIEENLRLRTPDLLKRFFEGNTFPEAGNSFTPLPPINKFPSEKPDLYHKVFISYAKEDYKYAVELYDYLNHHGYEPWLDKKSLLPGSNWDIEIKRALKQSDFIILLLSSTSVSKRGYIQREYKLALQYSEEKVEDDIYIIPVLINDCEVPISLNRFQWVQYDQDAFGLIVQSLNVQRMKLTGNADKQQTTQSQKTEDVKESQLSLSNKVHDVVANGLYRIMSDLDHRDTINRDDLLGQLEKIYEHSRDISYNRDSAVEQDFSAILAQAITIFSSESCRITIVGNSQTIWTGVTKHEENNVQQIIKYLLTVFIRDGNAANILMKFAREDRKVYLRCQYEGEVQISLTNLNSILAIIDPTKATIAFVNESKGATIDITYILQK